jgi:hypothetical protein
VGPNHFHGGPAGIDPVNAVAIRPQGCLQSQRQRCIIFHQQNAHQVSADAGTLPSKRLSANRLVGANAVEPTGESLDTLDDIKPALAFVLGLFDVHPLQ